MPRQTPIEYEWVTVQGCSSELRHQDMSSIRGGSNVTKVGQKNKLFDCPRPTDRKKPPDRKSFFFFKVIKLYILS